ncbi:MAG: hypothetical protein BWY77_01706 [bacterium ADurb.Bin431]|nr:MAG: hypothetical protein BWY77_01706 [bacterium ADurb.Bin431]
MLPVGRRLGGLEILLGEIFPPRGEGIRSGLAPQQQFAELGDLALDLEQYAQQEVALALLTPALEGNRQGRVHGMADVQIAPDGCLFDVGPAFQDDDLFDHIAQFANVARPAGVGHGGQGRLAKAAEIDVVFADEFLGKFPDQDRDVLAALAQRRHPDMDGIEAVKEVLAEVAAAHLLLELLVGGGDETHVGLDGGHSADAHEFARLEHAQQLDLGGKGKFTDLVEKDGALIGELEVALARPDRPGEGALFVSEEFGFNDPFGDGPAVDRNEGIQPPPAAGVDRPGYQFLAGAALAGDEHRDIGLGHLLDGLQQAADGLGAAENADLLLNLLPAAVGSRIRAHARLRPLLS